MSILVSIITVVYNGEKYIKDTIESVINQEYPNIEYIIIDGGSTDRTIEIINKYKENINIFISEKDEGIYDAMNKGIGLANGDIIGIINSDDYYEENTVRMAVDAFNKSSADIVYGDKLMMDEERKISKKYIIKLPNSLKEVNISSVHPTVFIKKSVYDKISYDIKYHVCADREFFYRAYINGFRIYKIDEILAIMRTGGVSSDLFKPLFELFVIKKKYFGFISACIFFVKFMIVYNRRVFLRKVMCKTYMKRDGWIGM